MVATRVAKAERKATAAGQLAAEDFPLLMHVDEIINRGAPVDIPWEKFVTDNI